MRPVSASDSETGRETTASISNVSIRENCVWSGMTSLYLPVSLCNPTASHRNQKLAPISLHNSLCSDTFHSDTVCKGKAAVSVQNRNRPLCHAAIPDCTHTPALPVRHVASTLGRMRGARHETMCFTRHLCLSWIVNSPLPSGFSYLVVLV